MRKLASIQKIRKIEPIDGADRLELAHVLGWQCVVKKDECELLGNKLPSFLFQPLSLDAPQRAQVLHSVHKR